MTDLEACRGRAHVVQPGGGLSFWQPKPANGHADPMLYPAVTGYDGLSMGFQTVAPGGRIRAHAHSDQFELQICFSGQGHVMVDGERHELKPGTACFLGPDVVHEIVNDGEDGLVQLWMIGPGGLENFFRAIGRERRPGEPTPEPFERPADVSAIEKALGFDKTEQT